MPRGPRKDFPGAYHHVYARGIEKRAIFHDDTDRSIFLDRTGFNLSRWNVHCLAWALMPNHFHFLVESVEGTLPSFMRCLMTGYSLYFNKRHERVGHLFQNRYRSQALVRDSHFRELIRYIHLNPLQSGLVGSISELEVYPWTGHRGIVTGDSHAWQDLETVAEMFAYPAGSWRGDYVDFVREGWERSDVSGEGCLEGACSSDIRGGPERVAAGEPPLQFRKLLEEISVRTGVPAEEILSPGKEKSKVDARRRVLMGCRTEMKVPVTQACRWLGIPVWVGRYLLRTGEATYPSQLGSADSRPEKPFAFVSS